MLNHIRVCNKCYNEFQLPHRRGVPYQAKCSRCGLAKTDRRLALLLAENSSVHRIVIIPKRSRNYVLYQMWKQNRQDGAGERRNTR